MKKVLCSLLALSLFVGIYFSLPKSINPFSGTDVYARYQYPYYTTKKVTLYYYNSAGSKKSVTLTPDVGFMLIDKKYYEVYKQEGSSIKIYSINVQKYINNGTFVLDWD